jgi:hypothetical protein
MAPLSTSWRGDGRRGSQSISVLTCNRSNDKFTYTGVLLSLRDPKVKRSDGDGQETRLIADPADDV